MAWKSKRTTTPPHSSDRPLLPFVPLRVDLGEFVEPPLGRLTAVVGRIQVRLSRSLDALVSIVEGPPVAYSVEKRPEHA